MEVTREVGFGYNERNWYRVNYIFVFVRHDKRNKELFSYNTNTKKYTPKSCDVFYVPESHGLTANDRTENIDLLWETAEFNNEYSDRGIQSVKFATVNEFGTAAGGVKVGLGIIAFMYPIFRIALGEMGNANLNKDYVSASHVRIYRTMEQDLGTTSDEPSLTASAIMGLQYRFLCDLAITQANNDDQYIEYSDGDYDLANPRTNIPFVNNDIFISSAIQNLYNPFFSAVHIPNGKLTTEFNGRIFCADNESKILLFSMFAGQGGFQGGVEFPYMYRTLFAANNFFKINEKITAVYGFATRLFIFTANKTYCVDNAQNYNADGTVSSRVLEISSKIGTIYPNAVAAFQDLVYFIDNEGDISVIRGSEVTKSGIKINAFRKYTKSVIENGLNTNALKAIVYKDILTFSLNSGQDYFNFRIYCLIERPSEGLSGAFTYDRDEYGLVDIVPIFYGEADYGEKNYGYARVEITDSKFALCMGNDLYMTGVHPKYRTVNAANRFRVCKLFALESYIDRFIEI